MAATVRINEYNTASETKTSGITNSNYGSVDASNIVIADYPLEVGANSYEKWQKLEVTSLGGSTSISQLKVWYTGYLGGADSLMTNANTTYTGAATYATPTTLTSTIATQTMPNSPPSDPNLGIGGSLSGELTTAGESDYLVHQLQTDNNTLYGSDITIYWRYIEVA